MLIVSLFIPFGISVFPEKAVALDLVDFLTGGAVPVAEVGLSFWDQLKNTVETTLQTVYQYDEWFRRNILDPIGWNLSVMVLQAVTTAIVNWINNGFEGSPAFVQSLEDEFLNYANLEFERFLRNNDLSFMCYPQSVRLALVLGYRSKFRQRARCTITGVVSNLQGYLNGDWSQGGFRGLIALTQEANNPYTANFLAQSELASRIAQNSSRRTFELQAGSLFKSLKVCRTITYTDPDNSMRPPIEKEICEIGTPGKHIADASTWAAKLGLDKTVVADSFDEIVSALFAQLARQALTGPGGFYGLSTSPYNGGAPYIDQLTPIYINPNTVSQLIQAIDSNVSDETNYRDQRNATLGLFTTVENKVLAVISCYNRKLNSQSLYLTGTERSLAQQRITSASSTLETLLTPRRAPLLREVASSTETISLFSNLRARVLATTSPEAIASLAGEYATTSPRARNRADLITAEQNHQSVLSELNTPETGLNAQYDLKLTECNAFPSRDTGGN